MTSVDVVVIGGGQAGLATANTALARGMRPLVLDAASGPGGSWPSYYDSLTLFSPARFSSLPGFRFPGDPERYPRRDEVIDYLTAYTDRLQAEVRFAHPVEKVSRDGGGFIVTGADGSVVRTAAVVAATGGFGAPYRPPLPGLDDFTGTVLHSSQYRNAAPFADSRVLVVGGGNSAVQIAVELAAVAKVSLTTRGPLRLQPQHLLGRDFHWWLHRSGLDSSRLGPRLFTGSVSVIDDGRYRAAIRDGCPDHRPLFARLDGDRAVWADGTSERVDVVLLATGYRPHLPFLTDSGALDAYGVPMHHSGVSTAVPGLGFVGLERQRSFASATLRGVGRDATHVLRALLRRPARSAVTRG
jgi:putative flavoprotein involved in K+ transport